MSITWCVWMVFVLFTQGLCPKCDKFPVFLITFLIWPLILGEYVRELVDEKTNV